MPEESDKTKQQTDSSSERKPISAPDAQEARNATPEEIRRIQELNPERSNGSFQFDPSKASIEIVIHTHPGEELSAGRLTGLTEKDLERALCISKPKYDVREVFLTTELQNEFSNKNKSRKETLSQSGLHLAIQAETNPAVEPVALLRAHADGLPDGPEKDRLIHLAREQAHEFASPKDFVQNATNSPTNFESSLPEAAPQPEADSKSEPELMSVENVGTVEGQNQPWLETIESEHKQIEQSDGKENEVARDKQIAQLVRVEEVTAQVKTTDKLVQEPDIANDGKTIKERFYTIQDYKDLFNLPKLLTQEIRIEMGPADQPESNRRYEKLLSESGFEKPTEDQKQQIRDTAYIDLFLDKYQYELTNRSMAEAGEKLYPQSGLFLAGQALADGATIGAVRAVCHKMVQEGFLENLAQSTESGYVLGYVTMKLAASTNKFAQLALRAIEADGIKGMIEEINQVSAKTWNGVINSLPSLQKIIEEPTKPNLVRAKEKIDEELGDPLADAALIAIGFAAAKGMDKFPGGKRSKHHASETKNKTVVDDESISGTKKIIEPEKQKVQEGPDTKKTEEPGKVKDTEEAKEVPKVQEVEEAKEKVKASRRIRYTEGQSLFFDKKNLEFLTADEVAAKLNIEKSKVKELTKTDLAKADLDHIKVKEKANLDKTPLPDKVVQQINSNPEGYVRRRAAELIQLLMIDCPKDVKNVTLSVAVAETKTGERVVLVATSDPYGRMRSKTLARPGEIMISNNTRSYHAEKDIAAFAKLQEMKLLEIGATKPVCQKQCVPVLEKTGVNISTMMKGEE